MAKRGRKRKFAARRRETTRNGRAGIVDPGSYTLRRHRALLTGDPDLPVDPLGVLLGRGLIDLAAYHAGRGLGELLATIRAGVYGSPGSVNGLWLAIMAGGAIRGPAVGISPSSLRALRTVAQIKNRLGDPVATELVMRSCAGEWVEATISLAIRRPLSTPAFRALGRLLAGLETVARQWSRNLPVDRRPHLENRSPVL